MSCKNNITGTKPTDPNGVLDNVLDTRKYIDWPLEKKTGPDGTKEEDRLRQVVRFFKDNHSDIPAEFAIAVAGVWSAECHIAPWRCNVSERDRGGTAAGKHGVTKKFETFKGVTYYYNEENMKQFGYGKGVAQWSWTRNLQFADWYNTVAPGNVKTPNLPTLDTNGNDILKTNMTTQTAFAWSEMEKRMRGDFLESIENIKTNSVSPVSNWSEYEKNIILGVDTVLRGFENGGGGNFATPEQMDSYKHGYAYGLKQRIGGAMSVYNVLKDDQEFKSYLRIT